MIGFIEGEVKALIRDTVIIVVNGVGYRLSTTTSVLARAKEGDAMSFWTHLAVRENSQDLYGFETKDELHWFELLLTVSGIGPKSALSVMNSVDIKALENAVRRDDATSLSRAFGVGKKTAEKIVLELKEKVGAVPASGSSVDGGGDGDVVEALISLGYSQKEAREASGAVPKDIQAQEDRIREAIRLASSK
ncbi:Holliday junction branch migration protein RuvA [Candidatus Kaiserbacteria bacterium CG10_big_fil_rev_8_21_14_0_10_45_20]|uniref:Holliday junction branch migration complex subunit RuvA n=1 Tax=Candidatus Kaiserbacteria bacterium CG10_big_fil_rev_8_21_14_0_10_45_20 TaxID=1974607 RepID=A0A2H0UF69_9BACT|nr:MAG: Holliday junction branch migration protein RuvA [Candidatus Kaiserbacteria bacterium CG10_big_fil_rev_8_21_14_0_10_45_20]